MEREEKESSFVVLLEKHSRANRYVWELIILIDLWI